MRLATEAVPSTVTHTLEQAALARGEAQRVGDRVVYGVGATATKSSLESDKPAEQVVHDYMARAFNNRDN